MLIYIYRKLVCTTDSDIRDCVTGNVQMVAQARRDMTEFVRTLNKTIIPVFEKTTADAIKRAEELKESECILVAVDYCCRYDNSALNITWISELENLLLSLFSWETICGQIYC